MTKIKSVDISDFRVYEGTINFDFVNIQTNEAANLVGIYAPNGFGKTSFFDAIEWTYTDKIRRFETGLLKKEVKEEDFSIQDRIVLTNRKSYKKNNNVKGKVSINTENGTIIKEVYPRRRQGKNIKDDYRQGKLSGTFDKTKAKTLPITNILTHDQVDSFLKLESPEGKFEALQDFWPEGKNALEKYKKLLKIRNKVASKEDGIHERISELTLEISNISPDNDKLNILKKNIEDINKIELIEEKYTFIDNSIGKEQYENFEFTSSLNKKKLSNKIKAEEDYQSHLKWLKDNYVDFNDNIERIEILSNQVQELKSRVSGYSQINKLKVRELSCQEIVTKYNARLDDINFLSENLVDYTSLQSQLNDLRVEKENCFKYIERLNRKTGIARARYIKITSYMDVYSSKKYSLTSDQKLIGLKHLEYKKYKSEIEKLTGELENNIKEQSQYNDEIKRLNTEVIELEYSISNLDWDFSLISEIFKESDTLNVASKLKSHIEEKNKAIEKAQIEFETFDALQDNLNRLIIWGEQHVTQTSQKSCPLCDSSFENSDKLLKAIEANKKADSIVSIKKEEVDILKNELNEVKLTYDKLQEKIIETVKNRVLTNKQSISYFREKLSGSLEIQFEKSEEMKHLDKIISEVVEFFDKYDLDISKSGSESISELQLNISNIIQENSNKAIKAENLMTRINNILHFHNESKVRYESTIRKNDNLEKMLRSSEVFQNCTRIISAYQFEHDKFNEVAQKKSHLESLISDSKTEELNVRASIDAIKSNLAQHKFQLTESDSIKLYDEKQNFLSKLKGENSVYHKNFAKYFPDMVPSDTVIVKCLDTSQQDLSSISDTIHQLDVLQTHIELATNQIN